jgi:hypothetical protein
MAKKALATAKYAINSRQSIFKRRALTVRMNEA